jgi:hypothetical protein
MELFDSRRRYLYLWTCIGFSIFIVGISLSVTGHGVLYIVLSTILVTLGSSILFPILVSYSYDRLRERWLGDEVWRLFGELSDAGITRIYKDREMSSSEDNAQTRLAREFRDLEQGDVRMIGVTLRVFFNPLGPFYHDIEAMLENTDGKVSVQALISSPHSPEVAYRTAIEEPGKMASHKSQTERDSESTVATVRNLAHKLGPRIDMRFFMPAPYCTVVIFPHIAYVSPNILAPQAPVRLPMILYRHGSHGYKMLEGSFAFLWNRGDTESAMI